MCDETPGAVVPTPERSPGPAADEELARRAQADPQGPAGRAAAGELLGRYTERVYRYCRRMVRDPDRARDLAQDAVMDALRGLPRFEARARFGSWLYAIVRNRCRTALRPRSLTRDEGVETDELPAAGGDPETLWAEREGEEALERMVAAHLEPVEQDALWLRCVERLPVDEITALLALTNATGARGVLQTARRKLAAALGRGRAGGGGRDER